MPFQISVPGKGVAEFPDDISFDQAVSSIQEEVPDFQPSRQDVFGDMKRKSESMAAQDNARFLDQAGGDVQNWIDRTSGLYSAGGGSIAAAFGRVLDLPLDSHYKAEEIAGRPVNRIEAKLRAPFQQFADESAVATEGRGGKAANFLSDVVGGILPSAAAGMLTGGVVPAAIAGTQQFGDTRKRVLDYYKSIGLPEYEAQSLADKQGLLSGGITAAVTKYTPKVLEKVPGIGKYLGDQGVEGLAKKILIDKLAQSTIGDFAKKTLGSAAGEATEEGINQFILEVVESKQLEPNLSWEEIAKRTATAAAQGAVGGAGVHSTATLARMGVEKASGINPGPLTFAATRVETDNAREQEANRLAEMIGLPPPHPPEKSSQRVNIAQQNAGIAAEAQLLRDAEARRQAGQITPEEYMVSVDRFEKARALERSQNAIPIQSPNEGVLRQGRPEVGLQQVVQGNAQQEVAPGTQEVPQAPSGSQAGIISQPAVNAALGAGAASPQLNAGPEINAPAEQPTQEGGGALEKEIRQEGMQVTSQETPQTPPTESKPAGASLSDRVYNKLDEWDKGLSQNTYSSAFAGADIAVAKLVLKTAKLAIRAGQTVSEAVRSAIESAKQKYPNAKFDSGALEKQILSDLQPTIAGVDEQSVVAQAAEPFVAENERAGSALDKQNYVAAQLSAARKDLTDLRDSVVQAALVQGIPVSDIPSINSSKLPEVAASLGADAGKIQELQKALDSEGLARSLSAINKEMGNIDAVASKLISLSPQKYAETLKYLAEAKGKLEKKAAGKAYQDPYVQSRSAEITQYEQARIQNLAKKNALSNPNVVEAITGPVEQMRKLLEETPELQGRSAEDMLADPLVSDDTKHLFVIRMSSAFREFDQHRENLESDLLHSEGTLQKSIDRLTGELTDARMDKAFVDVVMDDARRSLLKETGLLGGLNPDWVEWYDNNQSALRSFARALAEASGENKIEAQKLHEWMTLGSDPGMMPDLRNTPDHKWGVGDDALNEIKKALLESRATRNAVARIYEAGNQKLPVHTLRQISTAASGGDEALANSLFDDLMKKSEAEKRKIVALASEIEQELTQKRIELETLREAKALFDKVSSSPTFVEGRQAVEGSEKSFMQQFLLRKNDQFSLSGFVNPNGTTQEDVIILGRPIDGYGDFSRNAGEAILKWKDNAQSYVEQYEIALADRELDPLAPVPVQIGFDPAVYRGLKHSLVYDIPGILDGTLFHPDTGIDYSGSNQLMQTYRWFAQIDAASKLVKGIFGTAFRQSVSVFRDVNMDANVIDGNFKFQEIPRLLSAAMAQHPSVGGAKFLTKLGRVGKAVQDRFAINGNLQKYRELVFNPMANIGRSFGMLKVGTILPTGEIVTQADIDLLKRAQERDKALLRLAQKKGKGQSQSFGGVEYRRQAGSVGDLGTPRTISDAGDVFLNKLANAAVRLGKDSNFSIEQLMSGQSPIVSIWNDAARSRNALNSHVYDAAYRQDRDVAITPIMRQAYRNLAEQMEATGWSQKIETLGDLYEKLVQNFPQNSGVDPSQYVLEQLNSEIGQISRNAIGYADRIAKASGETMQAVLNDGFAAVRSRSSSIIETETSNNEFTKPAGKLIAPSAFYDYSSISPLELKLSKSRAIGESLVDMKNALRSAIQNVNANLHELESGSDQTRTKIARELGLDTRQAIAYLENVHSAMMNIDDAIGRSYVKDNNVGSFFKSAGSLAIGGALTTFTTAATNVLSSAASAFVFHSKINRGGAMALAAVTAGFAARAPRNVIYTAIKPIGSATAAEFKKGFAYLDKHHHSVSRMLSSVSGTIGLKSKLGALSSYSGYARFSADVDEVRRLGFSQNRGLFSQIGNAIRESMQYIDNLEQEAKSTKAGQIGRIASAPVKVAYRSISEAIKFSLLEITDAAVNATAIYGMSRMEQSWKDLAKAWASDRISKGMSFDLSNEAFLVTPKEYRPHGELGRISSEDNLAQARMFAQMAGTNLEQLLWNYYQNSEKGTKDASLFGVHEDAVKRLLIGGINASTFTNRPLKAQTNPNVGMLQALTGYQSNMAVAVLEALKGAQRNPGSAYRKLRKMLEAISKVIAGFIAFLIVGTYTGAVAEYLNRVFSGKISRKMRPNDKEYWNLDIGLPWRLTKDALNIAPYLGFLGRIQDGFRPDVSGGIFMVSAMNMFANYMMGAVRLPVEDLGWLSESAMKRIFGVTQLAYSDSPSTKTSAGVSSYAAAIDAAGLTKQNTFGPASGMAQITEKSGMLSKLADAGMASEVARRKGDTEGAAEASREIEHEKQRLIDYHREKITEDNERRGIKSTEFKVETDAIAAARRDWSDMNPIARALGHQPTQSEMDRINAQLSGDRAAAAQLAWDAFSRMGSQFPTAKGQTPVPQMVKQQRLGGGSRFGYSAPVAMAATRRSSGGRRRSSLRLRGRGARLGARRGTGRLRLKIRR
jgi:hypothetical protein